MSEAAIAAAEDRVKPGLRERKKAKTRAVIQAEALRLFRKLGYDATTIEQIADAAEVSPSTFFRYFPTKEEVILWDQFDPRLIAAFKRQPPKQAPLEALRNAFREVFSGLSSQELEEQRQRTDLIATVPSLRTALLDQTATAMEMIAEATAERTGRSADDFAIRSMAGAVLGVAMAATFYLAEHPGGDLAELLDDGIVQLGKGFKFR